MTVKRRESQARGSRQATLVSLALSANLKRGIDISPLR
jgi:hypothetical protein